MKKSEVELGAIYAAKVGGSRTRVRITAESLHGGWIGENLRTGREIRIRTAARLRYRYPEPAPAQHHAYGVGVVDGPAPSGSPLGVM